MGGWTSHTAETPKGVVHRKSQNIFTIPESGDLWTTAEDELYFHGSLWENGVQSVTAKTTLEANFKYLQVVAGTEDRVRRPTTKKKENTLPHTYYTLPTEYSGLLLTYK